MLYADLSTDFEFGIVVSKRCQEFVLFVFALPEFATCFCFSRECALALVAGENHGGANLAIRVHFSGGSSKSD
jgi:hypothetical protein